MESFLTGGPIPIVFGAFGETNTKTMDNVLKTLAQKGASTDDGIALSPHDDGSGGRGTAGPYRILMRKYRQAIGVMAVRSHANLKILRLHYIKPTIIQAQHAARGAARTHDSGGFRQSRPPWFCSRQHDPYDTFNEYREGQRNDYTFYH